MSHGNLCSSNCTFIHAAKPFQPALFWAHFPPDSQFCLAAGCLIATRHVAVFHMWHSHSLSHTQSNMQRAAWLKDESQLQTIHFFPFSSHLFGAPNVQTEAANCGDVIEQGKTYVGAGCGCTLMHGFVILLLNNFFLCFPWVQWCQRTVRGQVLSSASVPDRHTWPRPAELHPLPLRQSAQESHESTNSIPPRHQPISCHDNQTHICVLGYLWRRSVSPDWFHSGRQWLRSEENY